MSRCLLLNNIGEHGDATSLNLEAQFWHSHHDQALLELDRDGCAKIVLSNQSIYLEVLKL